MSEQLELKSNTEEVSTEKQNGDEVATTKKQNGEKASTVAVTIVNVIVNTVAGMVRSGDQKAVSEAMRKLLTTVFAMAALGEYDLGLRVGQTLYRYEDYQAPAALCQLLVARKVVVRDVITAKDFLNRKIYFEGLDSRDVVSPSDFGICVKKVCVGLRTNPNLQVVSRSPIALLADVTKYAVSGGKVPERDIPTVYFLTQKFDDEATFELKEWAKAFAVKLAG